MAGAGLGMAGDVGHHGPEGHPNLGCSQSHAGGGRSHGVEQVGGQRQCRLVDLADRRRRMAEPGIGQAQDRAGGHRDSGGETAH